MAVSQAALRRCDPARVVARLDGTAIGTGWRVLFVTTPGAMPIRLRERIQARLAAIVSEMSQWDPESLLSRFNRAPAGSVFTLPADFATVLDAALDVARRSGGAFDPTHGRAAALLGFGAEAVTRPPSDAALRAARDRAGWARLDYDPERRQLTQPGGLWLDFSGIAKGFAVDRIADLVEQAGFPDLLVEIGGELAGRGLKPDGQPWWVELEAPAAGAAAPVRIGLHDLAVATSGDYVRGAHTLDPTQGRPAAQGVASVSVLHERTMLADAWATALTVLGPERAAAVAAREGVAMRLLAVNGDRWRETISPALRIMLDR